MIDSLLLSHLPRRLAYHDALAFLREEKRAPEPKRLIAALAEAGLNSSLLRQVFLTALEKAQLSAHRLQGRLRTSSYWSPDYPSALRAQAEPPWNLFYLGALPEDRAPMLAVVGTRRPDEYGVRLVREFIPRIGVPRLQLVSGLAYGIDATAHEQACDSGIVNFAVLGSGPDLLYPSAHAELAARIIAGGGGLLSELPPGAPPEAKNFPRRNRIISGLADIIWVVQGAARSGSYHTAKHALDQQKTIVACPGDVFSELSQIPNRLIFDGAQTILSPEDLKSLFRHKTAVLRQQLPLTGIS